MPASAHATVMSADTAEHVCTPDPHPGLSPVLGSLNTLSPGPAQENTWRCLDRALYTCILRPWSSDL